MEVSATVEENSQHWALPPQLCVDYVGCDVHQGSLFLTAFCGILQRQGQELGGQALLGFKWTVADQNPAWLGRGPKYGQPLPQQGPGFGGGRVEGGM